MLFNSLDFAIFLPVVFFLYWFVVNKNLRLQNVLLLVASYFFYACWDWRFLSLILLSTVVDYSIGRQLAQTQVIRKRKILLWFSVVLNLGILGFFKYCNFFIENFIVAFSFFGADIQAYSLYIILPMGISFYTFQTLSYTIDVYRRKFEPTKDFVAFAAFVSFFPQLVAGPIERASNLLPQFYKKRHFEYHQAADGVRQILWGLFKKMVIGDGCAHFANHIFNNSADYSGSTLFIGAVFFAFQIYGDFSGYSDIAIGTARLFGFDLKQNFAFPYFSRDIAEFWRRWHISLSTWFRDYLYIPLGGSRGGTWIKIRNTFAIFLVSGFWHGANWTFIVWGALNAVYFLPLLLSSKNRKNMDIVAAHRHFPSFKELFHIGLTFLLTVFAWIFFRAESLSHAIDYLSEIFSLSFFTIPTFGGIYKAITVATLTVIFVGVEWWGRRSRYALEHIGLKWRREIRLAFYYCIIFAIYYFSGNQQEFIYFQF